MPWLARALVRVLQPLGKSPADCAEAMLDPIFTREEGLKGGGYKLIGPDARPAQITALHSQAAESVWARTKSVLERVLKGGE